MTFDEVVERLGGLNAQGMARCPAHHPDRTPSLAVTAADDRTLLKCFAKCDNRDVVAAVGITMADLFYNNTNGSGTDHPKRRIVATYDYLDADGEVVMQVVRYDPKDFRQRRPNGSGGWIPNIQGVTVIPYRLPELLAADPDTTVWIPEGEKDCDTLAAAGRVATCGPMGAGQWHRVAGVAVEALRGRDVAVIADKDKAGYAHARDVARSLLGVAAEITVVEALIGKDISDHIGAGKKSADLVTVASTSGSTDAPSIDEWLEAGNDSTPDDGGDDDVPPKLDLVNWVEVFAGITHDEAVVDGFAFAGRWTATNAKAKAGKSTFTAHVAVAVSRGIDPFDGTDRDPVEVMYLDGEMGRVDVHERFEALGLTPGDLARFHYTDIIPKLDTVEGAGRLIAEVNRLGVKLVVIDGINACVSGAEKDDTTWRPFYDETIAQLKRMGVAVVSNDNTGRDATLGSRGSTVKLDKPDAVIQLSRTDSGIRLKTTHRRTAAFPLEAIFDMVGLDGSEPIGYRPAAGGWPAGTEAAAALLEELGLPATVGRRVVRQALNAARDAATDDATAARFKLADTVVNAAIRYRKSGSVTVL